MIPYEEYRGYLRDWVKAWDNVIHEVTIEFRKKGGSDSGPGGFFGRMLSAAAPMLK